MFENAELLAGEGMLGYTKLVIKGSLCRPANEEFSKYVALAPVHDRLEFIPVFNLFEFQMFNGGTGDYQTGCGNATILFAFRRHSARSGSAGRMVSGISGREVGCGKAGYR